MKANKLYGKEYERKKMSGEQLCWDTVQNVVLRVRISEKSILTEIGKLTDVPEQGVLKPIFVYRIL